MYRRQKVDSEPISDFHALFIPNNDWHGKAVKTRSVSSNILSSNLDFSHLVSDLPPDLSGVCVAGDDALDVFARARTGTPNGQFQCKT